MNASIQTTGLGATPVFRRLVELLDGNNARYRLIEHTAAGKSAEVALIRGTDVGQGAKAMACKLLVENAPAKYILAILAADCQLDLALLAESCGGRRASLLSPKEIDGLTGCVLGAIPPFSFHPDLHLVADPDLFSRYQEIAFNAGRLDASIIVAVDDYLRIARPQLLNIRQR